MKLKKSWRSTCAAQTLDSKGQGLSVLRTFDAAGRDKTLEQFPTPATPTDRTGVRLTSYTATYDAAGQLQGVQEVDGNRVSYSYDPSGQLLSEARSGSLTYTYDGLGNRLSEVENGALSTYTYGAANRLLRIDASLRATRRAG